MTPSVLEKSIFLRAEPKAVWAFLTEPDKLAQWFHRPAAPLTQDQPYEMCSEGGTPMTGRVIAATPYERLEYTFEIPPMNGTASTVVWTLQAVAGGTKLSLAHHGLPQSAEAFGLILALDAGWEAHFTQMRQAFEPALAS